MELSRQKRIIPGSTIGILGGGQLGRMIALKAKEMGYRIVCMDATEDSPCGQVADTEFVAPLDDLTSARQLANNSDVITYEFENVSDEMLDILEKECYLPQGAELLTLTRHRIREKQALQTIGAPVAPWRPIGTWQDLREAVKQIGIPCVLKTTTGGYDGKGQYVIRKEEDLEAAWQTLSQYDSLDNASSLAKWILEGWVNFDKELSVIAARSPSGEIQTFPTAENIHKENILHQSIVPARIPSAVDRAAQELARMIAEKLNIVGLLAVEMFCKGEQLLVNELAPRPHNSGHYTMDACVTSQFEQHIRAICDLPLGDPTLLSPVVMVNVLGEHVQPLLNRLHLLSNGIKLHLYGKKEAIEKRKMGHLNVLAETVEEALATIDQLGIWEEKKTNVPSSTPMVFK
ncbi:5-(carboxyamino)imidazole ribonucleotide synthase [Fodinisporobacter ferrooxydans]|uniref:N5-carboxyaminoimidazole ribonucleotide synthase n=1 Tax=Fodinisporobacter ferrooxydans TaxID=2901836 RepID=A0ABY4CP50_9BACL|nr:5-(carboxyamino)imidazole ribonucleotide synthase [Alicyclobacillaceae bacterium MYW30-H2]